MKKEGKEVFTRVFIFRSILLTLNAKLIYKTCYSSRSNHQPWNCLLILGLLRENLQFLTCECVSQNWINNRFKINKNETIGSTVFESNNEFMSRCHFISNKIMIHWLPDSFSLNYLSRAWFSYLYFRVILTSLFLQ